MPASLSAASISPFVVSEEFGARRSRPRSTFVVQLHERPKDLRISAQDCVNEKSGHQFAAGVRCTPFTYALPPIAPDVHHLDAQLYFGDAWVPLGLGSADHHDCTPGCRVAEL